MTDKVQKIREEVVRIHNLLPIMDGDNISVNYADRICTTLEMYIDSMQEEPVSPCVECASISEGCKEICYDYNKWVRDNHKEESVSEELEDFALQYAGHHAPYDDCMQEVEDAIKAGAKWDREKTINKTCEWIKSMWSETDDRFKDDYTGMLIEDFKKYMEGE